MKKFLLSMLGVLIALPGIARDFTYEYKGQTLTYTVLNEDAKKCEVTKSKVTGDLEIPAIAKDGDVEYSVTSIRYSAFYSCESLTSVVIPNSVTKIGDKAFYECESLTSVEIPNSVTTIGKEAFSFCKSLTSVEIPNSVTTIGKEAFSYCESLTSVVIPNSVTDIRNATFFECRNLTSVEIPNSVTSIGYEAFYYCLSLTSVEIPNSVTSIGNKAFYSCESLTSVVIPNSVTFIGEDTFASCIGLTSVVIPNSVTSIGNYAFTYCESLTSVEIPNSVTFIGDAAFLGTGLTSVVIPNSVTKIGSEVFADCKNLSSVMNLSECALTGNIFIEEYDGDVISESIPPIQRVASYNYGDDSRVIEDAKVKYTIKDGDKIDAEKGVIWSADNSNGWVIGDYTGALVVPEGMTALTMDCFSYCPLITEIDLPNTLQTVGSQAFTGTTVKEILIPNKVTVIADDAFKDCEAVKIAAPDVTNFSVDENKTAVVKYDASDSKITDNFIYSRNGSVLYYAPLAVAGKFKVPETVTEIADNAFANCDALTEILLPESVSKLGANVWKGCNGIESVVCGNPVPVEASRDLFTIDVYNNATLYVPKRSKSEYMATAPWSYFVNISEKESGVDVVISDDIDFSAPVEVYNLQGVMVGLGIDNLPAGIYIVRQGNNARKIAVK